MATADDEIIHNMTFGDLRRLINDAARAFLRKFDRYATHVQWDDNARIRSVPLFLENTADIWYGELNPAPATFEQFRQALLRTFETTGSTFVDEQTFARYAQKPSESVTQYYTRIIAAGEKHSNRLHRYT